MRTKIVLRTLALSSLRLLKLNRKELAHKRLSDIVFDVLPEETRRSGKPREYFEKEMLNLENFNMLYGEERSMYLSLVKKVLDKAFVN